MSDHLTVLRDRLVAQLVENGQLRSDSITRAFRQVPRHVFLPGVDPAKAYLDRAIATKWQSDGLPISSSSQPAIMAEMLEQLEVEPGQRVLEIGAGTGYNAALLAHLVGPSGSVTTLDIDQDTVHQARDSLRAAGFTGVRVVCADGSEGWPAGAPYDRIIVTAAAADLQPPWVDQLTDGGRIVLPLALRWVQRCAAFVRRGDHLTSTSIANCGFMPLRGPGAGPDLVKGFAGRPGLLLYLGSDRAVDTSALYAALQQPGTQKPTGVPAGSHDLWGGLGLWLAVHEPDAGRLVALGPAGGAGLPPLLASAGMAGTVVLVGEGSLAALVAGASPGRFALDIQPFGPDGPVLADRLGTLVRAWHEAGRPATGTLRIRAYPAARVGAETAACVLPSRHTRLLIDW